MFEGIETADRRVWSVKPNTFAGKLVTDFIHLNDKIHRLLPDNQVLVLKYSHLDFSPLTDRSFFLLLATSH